jgi:hypothetical protein
VNSRSVFQILCVSVLAFLNMAAQVAWAASDAGTLQVGHAVYSGCSTILSGWSTAIPSGSYSPTGLAGGETVQGVFDSISVTYPGCPFYSELLVGGFASNPGVNWLTSVTCNGITNPVSTATFTYLGGGQAMWKWTTLFQLSFDSTGHAVSGNVSCTIVHN